MYNINSALGNVYDLFSWSFKKTDNLENSNLEHKSLFDIKGYVNKEEKVIINWKYFIDGEGNKFFIPVPDKYDVNTINKNVDKYNFPKDLINKMNSKLNLTNFYDHFINLSEKNNIWKVSSWEIKTKNLFNSYKLKEFRGNVFKIESNNEEYFLFSYTSPISELKNIWFDFSPLKILEFNLYTPNIFLLESLLFFYHNNKIPFLKEENKLRKYIKSIWIDLDNFVENFKYDDDFIKKIKEFNKQNSMYKMLYLVFHNIGLVGKVRFDYLYAFKYKNKKLHPQKIKISSSNGWMFIFEDIEGSEPILYNKFINLYNKKLLTSSFNYSLLYNEYFDIEQLDFYSWEDIENINKLIIDN